MRSVAAWYRQIIGRRLAQHQSRAGHVDAGKFFRVPSVALEDSCACGEPRDDHEPSFKE